MPKINRAPIDEIYDDLCAAEVPCTDTVHEKLGTRVCLTDENFDELAGKLDVLNTEIIHFGKGSAEVQAREADISTLIESARPDCTNCLRQGDCESEIIL
ncbi:hypothetical protein KKA95_05015 [Patescibacteria group bacterium]|nr:hypothetical protein [Patescibacteria group bacterium]